MKSTHNIRKFIKTVTLLFVLITIGSSIALSYAITRQCEEYMLQKASALISADATQLQLNINTYIDDIEGNVALMFSEEAFYTYDRTTSDLDEYDRIQIESSISDRIVDLGSLENYGDFCVVYADDNTVGWKSKTTGNMYSDVSIYEDLSAYITDTKTLDGWAFGIQDNFDRMYYIKRFNDNALILTSFYTRELEKVFDYPDELEGMVVRLVDGEGKIVYSSDKEELGCSLNAGDMQYLSAGENINAITDESLIDVGFCENGWMVMCTIPKSVLMSGVDKMREFAYAVSTGVAFFAILLCILVLAILSRPVDGYVGQLSEAATVDALSQVFNRAAFEEELSKALSDGNFEEFAFVMCDIDNFKKVNDTLGHDYGDDVIKRMGSLLTSKQNDIENASISIGRLGGDEFAMFISFDNKEAEEKLELFLDGLLEGFKQTFAEERKTLPLSLSVGVSKKSSVDGDLYRDLYIAADSALYISKESGKNQYNFYAGGDGDEE